MIITFRDILPRSVLISFFAVIAAQITSLTFDSVLATRVLLTFTIGFLAVYLFLWNVAIVEESNSYLKSAALGLSVGFSSILAFITSRDVITGYHRFKGDDAYHYAAAQPFDAVVILILIAGTIAVSLVCCALLDIKKKFTGRP